MNTHGPPQNRRTLNDKMKSFGSAGTRACANIGAGAHAIHPE